MNSRNREATTTYLPHIKCARSAYSGVSHTPLGAIPGLTPVLADQEVGADVARALEFCPLAPLKRAGDCAGAAAGEVDVAGGAHFVVEVGLYGEQCEGVEMSYSDSGPS